MLRRTTMMAVTAIAVLFGLLAVFGPPAVDAVVSATIFGF